MSMFVSGDASETAANTHQAAAIEEETFERKVTMIRVAPLDTQPTLRPETINEESKEQPQKDNQLSMEQQIEYTSKLLDPVNSQQMSHVKVSLGDREVNATYLLELYHEALQKENTRQKVNTMAQPGLEKCISVI